MPSKTRIIPALLLSTMLLPFSVRAATEGDYTYTVTADKATITGYSGTGGAVSIPSTLGGYPVTSIGDYAFAECTSLNSVTIPDSVTSIGEWAFALCTAISFVTISDSVTSIGSYAFYDCTFLFSVLFTGNAPTIAPFAFDFTPAILYYLPDTTGWYSTVAGHTTKPLLEYSSASDHITITGIDGSYNGSYLPIPATIAGLPVTSIGSSAFSECYSLTSVNIPDSVTSIGSSAFHDCQSLTSITIPDSVTSIGDYAFAVCSSLTSVTIPDSVTSISDYAFSKCYSLTSVTIGKSVTSIGEWAFAYCSFLTYVLFTGNAPTIGTFTFHSTPATIYYYLPGTTGWDTSVAGLPTVSWNPAVSTESPPRFTSGQFAFTITGNANIPIRIQACASLASTSWSTLSSTTLNASGTLDFSDPDSSSAPSRFYRVTFPQ